LFSIRRPVIWQFILYVAFILISMHLLKPYFSFTQQPWFFLSTTLCSIALLSQHNKKNIILFTIAILILFSFLLPTSLNENIKALQSIAIGLMLGLLCQSIWLISFPRHEVAQEWRQYLKALNQLSDDLFICLLESEYGKLIYKYERRIHFSKNKLWCSSTRINNLKAKHAHSLGAHANKLTAIFFSLAQIRYRISDHTLFSVCQSDLQQLQQAIARCILAQRDQHQSCSVELNQLYKAIKHFELTYQNVLQVTSSEPLSILLFIFDLYRLHDELREIDLNEYSN
jgi:hypothetical protein